MTENSLQHMLASSFVDDPFYKAVTADAESHDSRLERLCDYFEMTLRQATMDRCVLFSGTDGAAIWSVPENKDEDQGQKCRRLTEVLGQKGADRYSEISSSMAAKLPRDLTQAWYLSILAVREAARGRGIAARLVADLLSEADRHGLRCYLETFNPRSLPFYARMGFAHSRESFEPTIGQPYWLLWRDRHTPTACFG